jgi:hypothetical protein
MVLRNDESGTRAAAAGECFSKCIYKGKNCGEKWEGGGVLNFEKAGLCY